MSHSSIRECCVLALAVVGSAIAGSTTIASFANTTINAAQVDVSGNVYIAGFTSSATGGFGTPSSDHAFAAKLSPNGLTVYYVALGGNGSEYASAIAVDSTGSAYVFGQTSSVNFPVTAGALQTTLPAGALPGFVVKLDPNGKVVYSTFLGDTSKIYPRALVLDPLGNLILSGESVGSFPNAPNSPVTNPNSASDFVVKLNPTGSAITGAMQGVGGLLAEDGQGNIYVAGLDGGQGIPITPGVFQSKYTLEICGGDAQVGMGCDYQYVSKLNSSLTQILYSTYLTGSYGASAAAIKVDNQGDVFVAGTTNSRDYPTTSDALQAIYSANAPPPPQTCLEFCFFPPPASGFVTELNPAGTGLVYSTYFSGGVADSIRFAAFTSNGISSPGKPIRPTYLD